MNSYAPILTQGFFSASWLIKKPRERSAHIFSQHYRHTHGESGLFNCQQGPQDKPDRLVRVGIQAAHPLRDIAHAQKIE